MWDMFKKNFKYCPKCSSMNLRIREGKSIFCEDCSFVYFHNVAAAVAVVLEYQGKVLLTLRANDPQKGGLDLPGGFIDYNESAEAGLIREVKEELNLDVQNPQILTTAPNMYEYKGVMYPVMDIIFYLELDDISGIQPQDDVADYQWYMPEDIVLDKIAFPSTRAGLEFYLKWKQIL